MRSTGNPLHSSIEHSVLSASSSQVFAVDRNGRYIYVTPSVARAIGRTPEDMVGRTWQEIGLDEEVMAQVNRQRDEVFATGKRVQSEIWSPTAKRYYHYDILPIGDEGSVDAVVFTMVDITEKKATEEALRKSEARYRSLFKGNSAVMLLIDPRSGEIVDANQAASAYYNYSHDQLTKMRISEINALPPSEVRREMERSVRGEKRSFIFRHRLANGEVRDVEVFSGPIDAGERPLLYSVVHDITERKRAEEALRESEVKYRSLFENLHEAVALHQLVYDDRGDVVDSVIIDANPAALYIWGFGSVMEVRDKASSELFGPEATATHLANVRDAISMKASGPLTVSVSFGGQDFLTTYILLGEGRLIVSTRNITNIVEAQRRVEEERARLQAVLDTAPVGIAFAEAPSGRLLFTNDELWRMYRLAPKAIPTAEDYVTFRLLHEDGHPYAPEDYPMVRAARGEDVRGAVSHIVRSDGTHGYVTTNAAPIRDPTGSIVGAVGNSMDITEIKRIEDELRRSNADLQQFAYVASHDLREPLRTVSTQLQLLERKLGDKLDEASRRNINFAVDAAVRMRDMVDDLLAYSRVESKGQELTLTDMNMVAECVLRNLKKSIAEHDAEVTIEPLPTVRADEDQISQLLQNLIGNAIKYHREGERPEVRVSAQRRGSEWLFSVQDNGIGIPKEYHERIFQMFSRLHTRDEYEGTGIGLAIAKKIVDRHGGHIWVESEEGKGSTFCFTLPSRPSTGPS
mgnify:CR=1 FL=1